MKLLSVQTAKTKGVTAILPIVLAASMLMPSTAFAGTLFTYNGTGICGKASINSATIDSCTCTVTHTQTRNYGGSAALEVSMEKKGRSILDEKGIEVIR